jgi:hypothetical protein
VHTRSHNNASGQCRDKEYILPSLRIATTIIKIKLRPYKLRLYKLRLYKLRLDKLRPHKLRLYKLRPT